MSTFQEKKEKLHNLLKEGPKPCVAFSGGVDSSLLLFFGAEIRHGDILGVYVETPAQSEKERKEAVAFCKENNLPLKVITMDILAKDQVAYNHKERCYHCKKLILEAILTVGKEHQCEVFYDGSIADDKGEYRPGTAALEEAGVKSPLLLCDFTKTNVRNFAADLGIPHWNKPSAPCLLTRFPYHMVTKITEDDLCKIEQGERILDIICKHPFRLRWESETALRIEAGHEDMVRILEGREEMLKLFERMGFSKITLDLTPFKSGSFDRNRKEDS